MPWCPICKNEYQEGYSKCADCGCDLVDELEEEEQLVPICLLGQEEMAEKLRDFLVFSEIKAEYEYNETEKAYNVLVKDEDVMKAKAAFRGFAKVESSSEVEKLIAEAEDMLLEATDEEELTEEQREVVRNSILSEQVSKPTEVYVKKADVYKEMISTAVTFLVFANALIVVFVLGALDVISWFSGVPSLIVLAVMAIGCYIVGINACFRARKAERESKAEDKKTKEVEEWLKENISKATVKEKFAQIDAVEERYLKEIDYIKDLLLQNFSGLDDAYVDSLVDEFYDNYIDTSDEDVEVSEEAEARGEDTSDEDAE